MLVHLGFTATPAPTGFPRPAVILGREIAPISSCYEMSAGEIEVHIDAQKTVGERATTKRSPGNWF